MIRAYFEEKIDREKKNKKKNETKMKRSSEYFLKIFVLSRIKIKRVKKKGNFMP